MEKHWLICYMYKEMVKTVGRGRVANKPADSTPWGYANAVIDEHPTSWLKSMHASRPRKWDCYVLVSYYKIMPYEYNDLKDIL